MKNFKWRYDTRLYKTKKEALTKVGKKDNWSSFQAYIQAKNSITKEHIN